MIVRRRTLLQMLAVTPLAAFTAGCTAARASIYHDPECGCCTKWTQLLVADGRYSLTMIPTADRSELHRKIGLPAELAACHTAVIGRYAFEGHVPLADIARLLSERPDDVSGLPVPGMPVGSPGMENGNHRDSFSVLAFGNFGTREFSRY
jgi:hypothetical protein